MTTLNLVTAVSREYNLPRILKSILDAAINTKFSLKWIQIFDAPGPKSSYGRKLDGESGRVRIQRLTYGGPRPPFGIPQKNLGLEHAEDGFCLCLDDDNVVHPDFLRTIEKIVSESPGKRGFIFGQRRWDHHGNLTASPENTKPGSIDNAQFMVHTSLIGKSRYDHMHAGDEDGRFIMDLYMKIPQDFVFVDKFISYYNYLSVDRNCQ